MPKFFEPEKNLLKVVPHSSISTRDLLTLKNLVSKDPEHVLDMLLLSGSLFEEVTGKISENKELCGVYDIPHMRSSTKAFYFQNALVNTNEMSKILEIDRHGVINFAKLHNLTMFISGEFRVIVKDGKYSQAVKNEIENSEYKKQAQSSLKFIGRGLLLEIACVLIRRSVKEVFTSEDLEKVLRSYGKNFASASISGACAELCKPGKAVLQKIGRGKWKQTFYSSSNVSVEQKPKQQPQPRKISFESPIKTVEQPKAPQQKDFSIDAIMKIVESNLSDSAKEYIINSMKRNSN